MTKEQAEFAYEVGRKRCQRALDRGAKQRVELDLTDEDRFYVDVMSASAEMFASVVTGRRWLSTGLVPDNPEDGDLEGGVQVRWTRYRNGHLIIRNHERDDQPFVLVCNPKLPLKIKGWIYGREGKQKEFIKTYKDKPHEWWIPYPERNIPWRNISELKINLAPLPPEQELFHW